MMAVSCVGSGPSVKRHVAIGVGAAALLLLVYVGIVSAAQGLDHALDQAASLWYWMLLLAAGLGAQVGLFSFIRQGLRERRAAEAANVAASGGVSAGSMVACCAHHLSDVLPILGLSGVAGFLASYQVFFLIVGILSNAIGITMMLETIQKAGLCPLVARLPWDITRIRKGVIASSAVVAVVALVITGGAQV
ncbi:MAG: hypothetical protein HYX92_07000 [Chloroflexi bacterium]|nr:hypothetical protein [Chloroflexota bacterium]